MTQSINLTPEQFSQLNYEGELTLEALATLDTYIKSCCNVSATARKLHRGYLQVRKYLKQPYVRDIFQLKLLQKGVTPERIADVINEGLTATNGVYYEGNKVEDEPNWPARQKFAQLAAEIFEVLKYVNKTDNVNLNNNTVINIFRTEEKIDSRLPPHT